MRPLPRPATVPRVTSALALVLVATIGVAACGGSPSAPGGSAASGNGAASFVPVPGGPDHPTGPTQDATLVRAVDGDTIRVIVGGIEERVRYIGMDTPELNTGSSATPDPYADAATGANTRFLGGGRLVLEKDVSERDRYGRLLRDAWVERNGRWTLVNLALVAEGYAQVSTYPPDVKYAEVLRAAQHAARDARRGLWGGSTP